MPSSRANGPSNPQSWLRKSPARPFPRARPTQSPAARLVSPISPPRPQLGLPLAVGALALAADSWLTIQVLIPTYQSDRASPGPRAIGEHASRLVRPRSRRLLSLWRQFASASGSLPLPIPTSTFVMPPRCQPNRLPVTLNPPPAHPTPRPRQRGDLAASRRVHRGRLVDPSAVGTDGRQPSSTP